MSAGQPRVYEHPTAFHLGERALRREIETDRRAERWLWARAGVALLVVTVIVVLKVVFP
jgi:hypothetical protein